MDWPWQAAGLVLTAAALITVIRVAMFTEGIVSWGAFRCFLRERHEPVKQAQGGYKCSRCGYAGADLDEMGFEGSGYLTPGARTHYDRQHGSTTRTTEFEPTARGW